MISPVKIYSILGNPKSLIPLGLKDGASCAGLTTSSYATGGKEEAADRFLDEAGTEVIWLCGIPLSKKIIDKTIFKFAKFDSKYDVRNLQNKDIFEKTKKYAPTEKIKNDIDIIGKNKKLFKGLNIAKVGVAIGSAFFAYNALTNFKQKYTERKIKHKLKKELNYLKYNAMTNFKSNEKSKVFADFKNNNKNSLSFRGGLANFMLDPVKNMYVLDGGITSQRLLKSRDKQEFTGYAIKEGGFLFFMYFAGQKLQDMFTKHVDKKHNKSINLDARVIEDDAFKQSFKSGDIEKSLKSFPTKDKMNDAELYDFIFEHQDNEVIKAAKKSDIIQNYKEKEKGISGFFKKGIDTGKIDTRKYISLDDVRKVHADIQKLYSQYKASGEDADVFFNSLKKLKRQSIRLNIAIPSLALGVVIPAIMAAKRIINGDTEFATKTKIRNELTKKQKVKS